MAMITTGPASAFTAAAFRRGFWAAVPFIASNGIAGIAMGVAYRGLGLDFIPAVLFSLVVYSATAQAVTLGLWALPPPIGAMVVACAAMNARYLVMGAHLRQLFPDVSRRVMLPILFFLADASWLMTVAEAERGRRDAGYLLGASLPMAIGWVGGTAIGILIAWRRGSWVDWILPGATFFQAIPYFFLALVIVLIFGQTGTMLKWFPSLFAYDIYAVTPGPNLPYVESVAAHAILPALTVILASMAGFILAMRNNMVTTLDEDFVLVAAAKGLPARKVVWYAARNALLPVVANFTIAISLLVSGQILVEIVFNYPGIGFHLFDALSKLDYSLVQGIFVVITLVVLAANLLADVVYVLIDPRARQLA